MAGHVVLGPGADKVVADFGERWVLVQVAEIQKLRKDAREAVAEAKAVAEASERNVAEQVAGLAFDNHFTAAVAAGRAREDEREAVRRWHDEGEKERGAALAALRGSDTPPDSAGVT